MLSLLNLSAAHLNSIMSLMDWLHQAQTARQKLYQTEPDEKAAGSVWLPGPEVCRKLEGSWPDCIRQSQMKKLLGLSGFLDKKFQGKLKEVG